MFKFFSDKFNNLKQAISKTAENLVGNVVDAVENEEEFSDFVLDDMEDMLISADLGVNYASELVDNLRSQDKIRPSEVKNYLKNEFLKTLKEAGDNNLYYKDNELNIYFIAGVNGVGKTTLIGKLAYKFKNEGKKVLIAAGDTFRAAAEEQLDIWSKRAGADIVRRDKADPASVVYEAIQKAKNTGQNAFQQAKEFSKATDVTALAVTKLDGSAKGAIVLAVAKEMKLPVKLIGVGEKMEDLKSFNSDEFIDALFG